MMNAKTILSNGLKVVNAGPSITYALAEPVVGKKAAFAAFVGATVLDWAVPGVPVGSIAGIASFGTALVVKKLKKQGEANDE